MTGAVAQVVRHWAATHPGCVRSSNEDAYLCRPELGLFAVADGVGGRAGGAFASGSLMEALAALPSDLAPERRLGETRRAIQGAHARLQANASADGGNPATTVVALLLHAGHLACLWAGDSRAYLLRGGALIALTSDHSLVGEMVRAGELTEAEAERHVAGHVITRAVGVGDGERLLDKSVVALEPGDRVLACSDGLIKAVPAAELGRLAADEEAAGTLVDAAIGRRATDNVTAVILSIG